MEPHLERAGSAAADATAADAAVGIVDGSSEPAALLHQQALLKEPLAPPGSALATPLMGGEASEECSSAHVW
jgi:hypothetical protein